MGRSLPIAMQYGERLVLAPYQPLSSGFLISEIEPLLSRVKQTTAVYFLCADKQQLAAKSSHHRNPDWQQFMRVELQPLVSLQHVCSPARMHPA